VGAHGGTGRQNYTATLVVLTLACSAHAALQAMVVPALPTLRDDLGTTTTWVTWVFTGYLLVASVAAPLAGKLGGQHGKVRLLVISMVVLFGGCVLAIFAWNIWSLIAARAIQGAGGAVLPLTFAIVRDEFPPEKVGTALGITRPASRRSSSRSARARTGAGPRRRSSGSRSSPPRRSRSGTRRRGRSC
jgi:MFS family permease